MNIRHIIFGFVLFGALVRFDPAGAEDSFPGAEWQRATPAEFGWSETGLAQARAFSDQIHSSAVVIVHHGKVVAEWGDTTKPTELASIRKSLLSALIGIAVSEHLINLDSTLGELGIDDNPPGLTEVEKGATVRELLAEDRLCIIGVRRRCYIPVVNGKRIELFDRYGVMQIDAVAVPQ
jgi:CubicO group peptidase (beta-lactamase class C family)